MNFLRRNRGKIIALLACLSFCVMLIIPLPDATSADETITYLDFLDKVENKEIDKVDYSINKSNFYAFDSDGTIYKVPNPQKEEFKEFLLLNDIEVVYNVSVIAQIMAIIAEYGYMFVIIASLFILPKMMMKGDEKSYNQSSKPTTKLSDVVIPKSLQKEIEEIIDYISHKQAYLDKNVEYQNGLLLYGPPGTGKTLIAKAIAGETNCAFYSLSGSDFIEMYAGRGAARVRHLFMEARLNAPSIIFIDEIDAIGSNRQNDANSEKTQTINALLNELDGFNKRDNVMVIAATNQLETLDPALIRSGRFGKHIAVPLPLTKEERLKIIKVHANNKQFTQDVDFEKLAKITTGFSGADIAAILNEAVLISVYEKKAAADSECIDKAFNQFLLKGHEKDKNTQEKNDEKRMTAIHESGHAIVAKMLCGYSVPMISIVATTSGAGGYTISLPDDDISYYTKEMLENRIKLMYAGRASEIVFGYNLSTGASNDIEAATKLLKNMYLRYGMSQNSIGMNLYELYDGKIPPHILEEISECSEELMRKTVAYLTSKKQLVELLSEKLLEQETIDEKEFESIISEFC